MACHADFTKLFPFSLGPLDKKVSILHTNNVSYQSLNFVNLQKNILFNKIHAWFHYIDKCKWVDL